MYVVKYYSVLRYWFLTYSDYSNVISVRLGGARLEIGVVDGRLNSVDLTTTWEGNCTSYDSEILEWRRYNTMDAVSSSDYVSIGNQSATAEVSSILSKRYLIRILTKTSIGATDDLLVNLVRLVAGKDAYINKISN